MIVDASVEINCSVTPLLLVVGSYILLVSQAENANIAAISKIIFFMSNLFKVFNKFLSGLQYRIIVA